MGKNRILPFTEELRDKVIAVLRDDRISYGDLGKAIGVSKAATHKFVTLPGNLAYETGKKLEVWLDERG